MRQFAARLFSRFRRPPDFSRPEQNGREKETEKRPPAKNPSQETAIASAVVSMHENEAISRVKKHPVLVVVWEVGED